MRINCMNYDVCKVFIGYRKYTNYYAEKVYNYTDFLETDKP